jgi:hypothetical protein
MLHIQLTAKDEELKRQTFRRLKHFFQCIMLMFMTEVKYETLKINQLPGTESLRI